MAGPDGRTQIDTETVGGLLVVHGGAIVTLLALLPAILAQENAAEYQPFIRALVQGISAFFLGLVTALVHNHLRRRCSLAHQHRNPNEPCSLWPLSWIRLRDDPYCVCRASYLMLGISYAALVAGGVMVLWSGFAVFGGSS